MKWKRVWGMAAALLLRTVLPAPAAEMTRGVVVSVTDGDTLIFAPEGGGRVVVRLCDIDAPELRQAYGPESRAALLALADDRAAVLRPQGRDRYGRTVAEVSVDGRSLSRAQVALGMAEIYQRYSRDPALPALERQARAAGAGLWADPRRITPAAFRRISRRGGGWGKSRSCGREACAPKQSVR